MSSVNLFVNYRDNSFKYNSFNYEENKGYMLNLKDEWSDYESDDDCDYLVNVTKKLRLDPDYSDVD